MTLTFQWPSPSYSFLDECFSFTVVHAHYILIIFPKKSTLNLVKRKHPNYLWAITTSVINSDFFTRPFPYVAVLIAINQQRRALSAKARCSFPSICLRRSRAFPPYPVRPLLFSASESACGLKLFKCSLLWTSCLITYLLDLLSHIRHFLSKIKSKKSAHFHHLKGTERFNRIQVNIVSNKVPSDYMCSSELAGKRNSFQRRWRTEK